jgi:hypothetical protein
MDKAFRKLAFRNDQTMPDEDPAHNSLALAKAAKPV